MSHERIPIIIPAYEPDERMITLLHDIEKAGIGPVILVDDGSGLSYKPLFERAEEYVRRIGGQLLVHEQNQGKGRALKTAFSYILENEPDAIGAVTADSDGQHTVDCIAKVMKALEHSRHSLVLGVRCFDGEGIPWKSEFGNKMTMRILGYVSGIRVSDTQTGLRGIPIAFMRSLLYVKGERFEFETQMLLESSGKYPIIEVPIKTIYDSQEHHQTHFNPFVDSLKIYKILGKRFVLFLFASLSSSILDLCLFTLFCILLRERMPQLYIAVSTIGARIISAAYNYLMNYHKVFQSEESIGKSAAKYAILAILQMSCSAALVTLFAGIFFIVPEVIVKAIIDTILFFVSYKIQQKFVFRKTVSNKR